MTESPHHLLITGCNGQVGHELAALDWGDWRVTCATREDLDLSDVDAVHDRVRRLAPDMVINAAAYTAVDRAESEPDLAYRINTEAPAAIAGALATGDGLLIHFSTDYVFDGAAHRPYRETDSTAPTGVYGASKLEGERAIAVSGCDYLVLRTSWVYSHRGANFLLTMLRLAAQRDELYVVADQHGTPTYAFDLAVMTRQIARQVEARRDPSRLGLFHLGNTGETTWHGFASEIMRRTGNEGVAVRPISTADFPTPARRPAYSVLDKTRASRAFDMELPHWSDGLDRCLARLV
ncbi:MAG: dTDP-4-dehydrorhamnose reductase [Proteobacteria bacterium]|nr:MAG: dTDP-4-dehydrorhamnose reductase [Pseudomonadota bacterium]